MKKCLICNTEMKQIGGEIRLAEGCILTQKGDNFLYKDSHGDLTAYYYVCPQCGLIQQYVPDSLLKHISNM